MSYYLSAYGKILLAAAVAALIFAALICFVLLGGVRIREVKAVKLHPFRKRGWVYAVTAVFLVAGVLLTSMSIPRSCDATLSLNYDGASRGLNPNDTRFNQADVLGREVLQRMEDKHVLSGVTAEDLRDVLYITAEGSGGSIEDENYRVSSEYRIGYRANRKTDHLSGENVLQVFAGAYREWFAEQYTTDLSPLETDYSGFNGDDYLDICDELETEAKRIENFMSVMSMNTRSFQSEDTGEGFSSIGKRAEYIQDTLISDLRAFILENSLSKDTQTYLGRLSAQNIFLDFDARKEAMENGNWLSAVRKYEDDMARIVLVPTYDDYGQFYMSQTKIGVDEFAEQAEISADKMIALHANIASNNYVARQLSAGSDSEEAYADADRLIVRIESEMSDAAERARSLIREYDATRANGYMTLTISSWESRAMSALKDAVVLSAALFVMLQALCFLGDVREYRKKVS